jgi:hypothetical protein
MESEALSYAEGSVSKAGDFLERLIDARQKNDRTLYAKILKENGVNFLRRAKVTGTIETKLCVCVLKKDGVERRFPGTTQQECLAAGSGFGLEWEWECGQ